MQKKVERIMRGSLENVAFEENVDIDFTFYKGWILQGEQIAWTTVWMLVSVRCEIYKVNRQEEQ